MKHQHGEIELMLLLRVAARRDHFYIPFGMPTYGQPVELESLSLLSMAKLLAKPNGALACKNTEGTLKYFPVNSCLRVDLSAHDVQASLTCSNEIASFLEIKPRHADRGLKIPANWATGQQQQCGFMIYSL